MFLWPLSQSKIGCRYHHNHQSQCGNRFVCHAGWISALAATLNTTVNPDLSLVLHLFDARIPYLQMSFLGTAIELHFNQAMWSSFRAVFGRLCIIHSIPQYRGSTETILQLCICASYCHDCVSYGLEASRYLFCPSRCQGYALELAFVSL